MKRIAAVSAVALGLLAVPATTAMASTPQGGPSQPWQPGQSYCQIWDNGQPWGGGHHHRHCQQQTVTFDMQAYSSTATETQGPPLFAGEGIIYQQQYYTVGWVWGQKFTLEQDGSAFTNDGWAIWGGTATIEAGQQQQDFPWGQ